jgi:hypothetical protein
VSKDVAEKIPRGVLPMPSTDIISGPSLEHDGGTVTLRFTFDRDGTRYGAGVVFTRVRSLRWTAESHCTAWQIEDAYDTIAEVEDSEWVTELLMAEPAETWGQWAIRHFMLYIDSFGCCELAAESWSLLDEEQIA